MSFSQAIKYCTWRHAITEEFNVFLEKDTSELVHEFLLWM